MPIKVLIADDEDNQQELIRFSLVKNGFDVIVASNGLDALEQIETQNPDLVILDWMMPQISGVDLCRKLRARADTRDLPIILSARAEEGDRSYGLDCGADDYIPKPFFQRN